MAGAHGQRTDAVEKGRSSDPQRPGPAQRPGPGTLDPADCGGLVDELRRLARRVGLAAVGIAPATPMEATRRVLEERRAAGLAGGMQFTYRNPARSTEPTRVLPGATALVVGAWRYGDRESRARGAGRKGAGGGAWPSRGSVGPSCDGVGPSCAVEPRDGVGQVLEHGLDRPGEGGLDRPVEAGRPVGTVARYARQDHYRDLRTALGALAEHLVQAGWSARVVADDNALVDRAAAERAGLGWFGKNSNILLPGQGSWFILGSVVTDAPLPPDQPVGDGCGPCRRCIGSCPTGALVSPGVLDARRCLAWLLQAPGVFPFEYRDALGDRIYGCDDCQEVCPANRAAARLAAPRAASAASPASTEGTAVDLLDMLAAPDEVLLASYGRWYIARRDPRYLRRNALVVLGNVADGRAPAVQATLYRYLTGPDEMLQAHAVWAACKLGRRDLLERVPGLLDDPSELVQDELRRQRWAGPREACH
ncbi:MAG: tRNA epoxyqueuosine(34) reductase QueG [Acidimicrobiales bacterium]